MRGKKENHLQRNKLSHQIAELLSDTFTMRATDIQRRLVSVVRNALLQLGDGEGDEHREQRKEYVKEMSRLLETQLADMSPVDVFSVLSMFKAQQKSFLQRIDGMPADEPDILQKWVSQCSNPSNFITEKEGKIDYNPDDTALVFVQNALASRLENMVNTADVPVSQVILEGYIRELREIHRLFPSLVVIPTLSVAVTLRLQEVHQQVNIGVFGAKELSESLDILEELFFDLVQEFSGFSVEQIIQMDTMLQNDEQIQKQFQEKYDLRSMKWVLKNIVALKRMLKAHGLGEDSDESASSSVLDTARQSVVERILDHDTQEEQIMH